MRKLLVIATLLMSISSIGQKLPFKYGKVTMEELQMSSCEFHPEAYSMYLYKYGDIEFKYTNEKGWQYVYSVIIRKKIFNKLDADAGNMKIRIYNPENGRNIEKVTSLNAVTFNLENGKVVKTKLSRKDQYEKRLNDKWSEFSFAMPDVKEGSVLDIKYEIVSDFLFNLQTWKFQEDIPVGYSEFRYCIPQYFNYQVGIVGNVIPVESQQENFMETFTYEWKSMPKAGGVVQKGTNTMESMSLKRRFVSLNIPPVEDEPYMNNKCDIPSRIVFQLMSIIMPNKPLEVIAGNYDKFNNELMDMNSFGERLKKGNFSKKWKESVMGEDALEKAISIYQLVQNHFTWDGYNSFLSSDAGSTAFNKGEGNVAAINLSFIAALREYNINAYPVILSTRGHGTVNPVYPSFDEFNYVIAYIRIGDNYYLADATTQNQFGVLPVRCLNGNGRIISESGGEWVSLKNQAEHNSNVMIQMNFQEDELSCVVNSKQLGYAAAEVDGTYKKQGSESFVSEFVEDFSEWNIENFNYDSLNNTNQVKISFKMKQEHNAEDIIYLQPLSYGASKKNPFTRETRFSLIDFPYKTKERVYSIITIPQGYTAELPETSVIQLPEKAGVFKYVVSQNGNSVSILSDLQINKTEFSAEEYGYLKQFLDMVAEKNNQIVVLKKI
ncbi:MAG: DUF3857 domain-containing protein [Bacteroidales bacterium]|nr:DUF3857 domain-containing protein [Bacteroidales bacterium]